MNKKVRLLAQAIHEIGKSTSPSNDIKLVTFLGMTGRDYKGDLMVIGRATNGWRVELSPHDGSDWQHALQKAEQTLSASQGSANFSCPMAEGYRKWERTGYSKRSAFWRCIRLLVGELGIADINQASWPSALMWTNLFKISHDEGNPTAALQRSQISFVKDILCEEIREALPRRILFLTGMGWAREFLEALGATCDETSQSQQIQAIGTLKSFDPAHHERIRIVVATHPQGKPSQAWVTEVACAFSNQYFDGK